MRQVNRRNATVENVFIADDGKEFAYKCEAIEHERKIAENKIKELNPKRFNSSYVDLNIVCVHVETDDDLVIVSNYLDLIGAKNSVGEKNAPLNICIVKVDGVTYGTTYEELAKTIKQEIKEVSKLIE